MPATPPPASTPRAAAPFRRLWWWVGGAFALGLLLFAVLWFDQRNDGDFFKVQGTAGDETAQAPGLPAPLPEDVAMEPQPASPVTDTVTGMPTEEPRIIETAPAPPPPAPVAPPPPAPAPAPVPVASTAPQPIRMPAPTYPREAQRRGIGGTVFVRVDVDAAGNVERLELDESSGNRELDRAALEAVRRWQFRPATRDGRAVAATVRVPINFRAN